MKRSYLDNAWAVAIAALMEACSAPAAEMGRTLTLADGGASDPTVAVDAVGRVHVAWVGTRDGVSNVWLGTVAVDGGPSEPVRVNDVEGDAAPHLQAPAQVAVGPEGDVYVAWTNNIHIEGRRFPASSLRFARSTDGGETFAPAVTVNDDADGPPTSHTFHNVMVADDGTVVVSWLDGRRDEGGVDGAMEATVHAEHDIGGEAPGPDVRVAVSTDGGRSFSPSRIVDRQTCPCCRTSMALGPDGTLYLSWREIFERDIRDIVVARSQDLGRTWDDPVRVAADDWVFPGCPHAGAAMTVDRSGALHVGWYTGKPDAPGLYYASSRDSGRTFTDPEPLLVDAWVPPSQVALASSDAGGVWATWEDRRTDEPVFRLVLRGGSADADGREYVGTNPALAAAGSALAVAWLDDDRVRVSVGADVR